MGAILWKAISDLARKATAKGWKALDKDAAAAAELLTKSAPKHKLLGYGPGSIGESIFGLVGDQKILAPGVKVLNPEVLNRPTRAGIWVPTEEASTTANKNLVPALQFKDKSLLVDTTFDSATTLDEHLLNTMFQQFEK